MLFVSPMDNNDWDLFAIVRSCKANTSTPHDTISENPSPPPTPTTTNTTTNNTISHQKATPPYFDNFTATHRNSLISLSNTTIPIPTSTIPTIITNTSSPTTTIPTLSTPIIPTKITTTNPTTFTTTTLTSTIRTLTTTIATPATTTIPTIITNTNPNTFVPIPTTIINTFNATSPTNNSTTITPIYTNPNLTSTIRTPTTTPTTTIVPTIITNTTSSPTATIPTFSTTTIPTKITSTTNTITNTNTSFHNSNRSSTFFDIPTLIEQQLMQPNELTELEKSKLNFNLNTIIPIPTTNTHTFNIATPTTNNTTITPIYTTSTLTISTPITTTTTPATTDIPTIINNTTSSPTITIPIFNTAIPKKITTTAVITPIYTTTNFTIPTSTIQTLTTTRSIHTTTIIPTTFNNTTSSPTTIVSTLSITSIPTYITTTTTTNITTNTNNSVHNSKESSAFLYFPTLIKQQNELTELEKLKLNFNPITTIPIPTNTFRTFNITNPNTTNTMITPIYTTNTFTTPIPTSTICTHTTTTAAPTMNNTNISVQGTNQYSTISDFTIPIKQQIQPNNNNQVFFPKHVTHIEITTVHFDRAYNQPPVPQQPLRESNQLPLLPQINSQVLSNTHPQEPKHKSRKRKYDNQMRLEGHVIEEKAKEDSWTWIKYGQKPISGSPHPRSYYKCNSFRDCPARKMVQKSKTKDNTYVVTYKRDHNHTRELGSSPNVGNFHLPNVAVLQFDQPESSNTRVLIGQSKIPYQKTELIKSRLHATGEARSSSNVSNLGSPNVMMLQFDELESNNGQIFAGESDTKFTGSLDDDDAILIEKMKTMLEDFLLDFNHLRALFP